MDARRIADPRHRFADTDRFLAENGDELVARRRADVALQPRRASIDPRLADAFPQFLRQFRALLEAEDDADRPASGPRTGPDAAGATELREAMRSSAAAHGRQLWTLGFTVDQVVHDYADMGRAIFDFVIERDAPFGVEACRTLNRYLDGSIAGAVVAFGAARDAIRSRRQSDAANERLGHVVHELRNALGTATLALKSLETGRSTVDGATGAVLKRSVASLASLIDEMIEDVRERADDLPSGAPFDVDRFVDDAVQAASLEAGERGCTLVVSSLDPGLSLSGDRERLLGALANLLQNAAKYTRHGTRVELTVRRAGGRLLLDVRDRCGGLPPGLATRLFAPFTQRHDDRTGLGLGLSIARRSVERAGGTLAVRDLPGEGCVFTIDLPLRIRGGCRIAPERESSGLPPG